EKNKAPENPTVHYHLGLAYEKNEQPAQLFKRGGRNENSLAIALVIATQATDIPARPVDHEQPSVHRCRSGIVSSPLQRPAIAPAWSQGSRIRPDPTASERYQAAAHPHILCSKDSSARLK